MGWRDTYPLSSTGVSASVETDWASGDGIRSNWLAIETWTGIDHSSLSAATSGQHLPSKMDALLIGAASASEPESGALWLNSTTGSISVFTSGGWRVIAVDQFKARASGGASDLDGSYFAAGAETKVVFNTEKDTDFDPLSAYNSTLNVLTVPVSGTYLVRASVVLCAIDAEDDYKDIGIFKNGGVNAEAYTGKYGWKELTLQVNDILRLDAADYLDIRVWNGNSTVLTAQERQLEVIKL